MTTEALKSASITNRDAGNPQVRNSVGKGEPSKLNMVDDYVTTTSGVTSGSTYTMVRIPSNAIVKSVKWEAAAMTQGAFDVGLYYANNHPTASLQGTAVDADFFATATSAASAVLHDTDITNESGTYTIAKRIQPIWQAAGLSTDPGGDFDVVFTSTNTITAGAAMAVEVRYALNG